MVDIQRGFSKDRFPNLKGNNFDCGICYLVCQEPKECTKCGAMYCAACIDAEVEKSNHCKLCFNTAENNIQPIKGALSKIYKNLDIRCQFPDCGAIVKLCDLAYHEGTCQLPKCEFFEFCENHLRMVSQNGVCGEICGLLKKIKEKGEDALYVYEEVKNFTQWFGSTPFEMTMGNTQGGTSFQWDVENLGSGIEVSNERKSVFLNDDVYTFRSVVGDQAMFGGVHYWEIYADERTENELKIGVACSREFDMNLAFSDFEFGFAYYGLGQLRHFNAYEGEFYGKKFKKEGVLGVCLDMNRGTLSFALNGEYMGIAFKNEKLKQGPIFAAVAMAHIAGCSLGTEMAIPSYFYLE